MAIAADSGAGSGAPFVKFQHGMTLVGAFASDPGKCRRQKLNFETKKPEWKDDGAPLLEEVMHFVAMPGTTAGIGDRSALQPIEAGMHVRFGVDGHKWGQVIDARKALPAANGFAAGQTCSGDVYTIAQVGWSAKTENPGAAEKAGFTVVDGRIVLRSQEDKDRYVLAQSRSGGNTNPAVDYEITIRRPESADKRWEQEADALYLTKPWESSAQTAPTNDAIPDDEGLAPF